MAKIALLIGVSDYEEGLEALPAATKDIAALREVLINPAIGDFAAEDVTVLPNPSRQVMEDAIYTLFANRQKEDLVLLYFSGHGVVDEGNRFYFTTRQTRKVQGKLMPTTALIASTVQGYMEESRSQRQVAILDSCFSGAFAKGLGAKDSGSVNLEQVLGGKGRAILTASTSTQYALTQAGFELSVYTHFLVEGLRTGGAAQVGKDGISVEDLHVYANAKVREAAPAMTPEFYPVKEGYTIQLAKSPKDDPALKYRKEAQKLVHEGRFSIPARRLLDSLRQQLNVDPEVAKAIEEEELRPYREYQRKVQEYEETLKETLQTEPALTERTKQDLKDYQHHLGLRDEDVVAIEKRYLGNPLNLTSVELMPAASVTDPSPPEASKFQTFTFDVVTVNAKGEEINRKPGQAEYFAEDLGNDIVLKIVKIPGGTFEMGSNEDESEQPIHSVTVAPFGLGMFPVTQEQYAAVMETNPSHFKGAKCPVECVSWDDAVQFCQRLSEKTGNLYRLPSEAEWEYTCRAETKTHFYFGDTLTSDLANYNGAETFAHEPKGKCRKETTEVGIFPPNAFGLYDTHGNVWEWCACYWHGNYQGAPADGSAWSNKNNNHSHLIRGGSWNGSSSDCRSAYRYFFTPDFRLNNIGFRVVCDDPRTL